MFGIIVFFIVGRVSLVASAAPAVPLFTDGKPSPRYLSVLNSLSAAVGRVRFSDNFVVSIIEELGRGGTSRVYREQGGEAVRLARPEYYESASLFLAQYATEHTLLEQNGVSVPKLLAVGPTLAHRPEAVEYVRVEWIEKKIDLGTWLSRLSRPRLGESFEKSLPQKSWAALKLFAISTQKFSRIGDLSIENVVWTGTRWVLIDWAGPHALARSDFNPGQTVFSGRRWSRTPKANWRPEDYVFSLLDEVVRLQRAKGGDCSAFLGAPGAQTLQMQWPNNGSSNEAI